MNDEKLLIENVKFDHHVEFVRFRSKQIINCLWGFKIQAISQAFDLPFNLASAASLDIMVVMRA